MIHAVIATLSEEDKKNFIRNLRRRNKRNDTKNIALFKLLDTPHPTENLDLILYGKRAKGAYHALCKRLNDALIDFIATKDLEKESSKEMAALKLVLASRVFFEKNQLAIGFKTLAKAELIGVKYALYPILNEIYFTQISHAHLNNSLDLEKLIRKYQKNKKNIVRDENLNLFYAAIQNELNQSNPKVADIIQRNLVLYNISVTKNLSYQSLFKILQICNQVAHVTRNYYAILEFVENACQKITTSERIEDSHLYEHIQVLYYLSNTYFRIRKFKASAVYLKTMKAYMLLENKKYHAVFYPQFVLLENLLLIYTGKNDIAIENLKAFNFKLYKNQQDYVLDVKLTLVVALFLKEKFKEAFQIYQDFHHSDTWYANKTGFIWVIQKNLIEILLLMELDYADLVESRINGFRKKHRIHLIDHDESIVLEFLKLISSCYFKPELSKSKEFEEKVSFLLRKKRKEEDVFTLSFYAWLKAKVNHADMYQTCLSLVSKA